MANIELDLTGTFPAGASVDVTVYEDIDGDSTAENQATATDVGDSAVVLSGFEGSDSNDYWLDITFDQTDDTVTVQISSAQIGVSPQDPTGLSATPVSGTQIDLSWTDNASDESGYAIERSEDGSSWAQIDTVAANTTTYSDTGLENGEKFWYRVKATSTIVDGEYSNEDTATTTVPAPTLDSIDNSTEDQLTVNWTLNDNSTDGNVEVYRSTDGSLGSVVHTETTLATTSFTDTGLDDGEQYHYTIRRNTDHASADSSQSSSITVLPVPTLDDAAPTTPTQLLVEWTDNADAEAGYRVLLSTDGGSSFSQDGSDLAANTESYTTTDLSPDTYTVKVRVFTDHTTADSGTQDVVLTGLPLRETRSTPWRVEIDHPDTGNILRPTVVGQPQRNPVVNGLPSISIPVERSDKWQDSTLEGATMRVWFEGERQPIDELEDVSVSEQATVLSGRGGLELLGRVEVEYDQEEIHTAAENLIDNNTSYVSNVDTPQSTTSTNETIDTATTDADWQTRTNIKNSDPVATRNGNIELLQACFTVEGEATSRENNTQTIADADASGAQSQEFNATNENAEWDFTLDYTIPAEDFDLRVRDDQNDADGAAAFTWYLIHDNGNTYTVGGIGPSQGASLTLGWSSIGADYDGPGYTGPDLTAGDYSIRLEIDATTSGQDYLVDVVAPNDSRFSWTFDNTTDGNDALSGPELYPDAHTVVADQVKTVDAVTGGRFEGTFDDTTGNQQIELSNDQGATYGVSGSNTATVEGDFASKGPSLKWRVTLGRYGSQAATPTSGINGQKLQALTLKADLDSTPLVVNQSFDDRLLNILREFADIGDYVFEFARDGLTESVEWTQPGQRTSDKEPTVATYEVTKSTSETVEEVDVYGSAQSIVGETFAANHGVAVALANGRLHQLKEVVRDADSGTRFEREADYTIDYDAGEVTTLAAGAITDGNTLEIDYTYQTFGEYTASGVSDPDQRVVEIPGLTTNTACEQAAKRIVEGVGTTDGAKDPRWEMRVVIPNDEAGWSVVDEIDFSQVPTGGARSINRVENAPGQTVVIGASRETIDDAADDIRTRVRAVSRKA